MHVPLRIAVAIAWLLGAGYSSAQETNAAAAPGAAQTPDIEDISRLLNETLKAYGSIVSDLNTDSGQGQASNAASNLPAAELEGAIREVLQSGQLGDALASTARAMTWWERIAQGLSVFSISLVAAVLSSVLTLAGDRWLRKRRIRRRQRQAPTQGSPK